MVGALRLVSVEQGYDPRDYALIAFGGAGPIHANALSKLLGSWPSIIPPGPGVLCALGDATTAVRDERARTFVAKFSDTSAKEVEKILKELAKDAAKALIEEGVPKAEIRTSYQVDLRYHGQGLRLTVELSLKDLQAKGLKAISDQFDEEHKRLFTFALPLEHEVVTLRATVQGQGIKIKRPPLAKGGSDPKAAAVGKQKCFMDGKDVTAIVYDRAKLKTGNKVAGPAIVMEMDSTTVVLPKHTAVVDGSSCLLIYPDNYKPASKKPTPKKSAAKKPAAKKAKPAAKAKASKAKVAKPAKGKKAKKARK
jgi:N-methylhydantoinase A